MVAYLDTDIIRAVARLQMTLGWADGRGPENATFDDLHAFVATAMKQLRLQFPGVGKGQLLRCIKAANADPTDGSWLA
jgi:hypothetical protein